MAAGSKRVTFICARCGSSNVISDTRSKWDVRRQEWVVVGHYDPCECASCEEETSLREVELAPAS